MAGLCLLDALGPLLWGRAAARWKGEAQGVRSAGSLLTARGWVLSLETAPLALGKASVTQPWPGPEPGPASSLKSSRLWVIIKSSAMKHFVF